MVAAAIIGGAALSAGTSLISGGTASAASKQAAELEQKRYEQTRADLSPYNQAGQSVLPDLTSLARSGPYGPGGVNYLDMASRNLPDVMTQAQLEATPGYQFTRDQGLKATQAAAAARGLGMSGASLKGAATYATGLADSTYAARFGEAQTKFSDILGLNTTQQGNLTNQFGRLKDVATIGENAGAQTGTIGAALGKDQGNALQAAGGYTAAGQTGVGSAITGGINNYLQYSALQNMQPGGNSGQLGGYQMSGFAPAMTPGQVGVGGFVAR